MRLLMTTDTVGGVWTFTCELSEELLRRGHSIALVSFGRSPSPDQTAWCNTHTASHGGRFQFTPTDVPLEWMDDNDRAFTKGEPLLHSVAGQFRPDLLLSNQFCFGALDLPVPRVVVAHSDVLSWAEACKPVAQEPSPWLNRYTSLVQSGLMQAQSVVAPTRWMLNALKSNFFLPNGGTVIANGRSIVATHTPPTRQLQAITAGRLWDEAKGLDLFTGIELPLPVLVAGDRPPAFNSSSEADHAHLQFLGHLSQLQLQLAFRESALYLCTSRYEPFGLAPLEAALCGCAVVARDLPSLREVWSDAAVYFTDAESLRAQVQGLVDDPAALAEAQSRASLHAAQFTAERMANEYLAVFENALATQRVLSHVA